MLMFYHRLGKEVGDIRDRVASAAVRHEKIPNSTLFLIYFEKNEGVLCSLGTLMESTKLFIVLKRKSMPL